jgi:hypothetical protein
MIQVICTLPFPFVEPQINKMTPNSPRDTASLPQNATLHCALWPKISKYPQAHLMHSELFVLGRQREICKQSSDQYVMNRAFAHNKATVLNVNCAQPRETTVFDV